MRICASSLPTQTRWIGRCLMVAAWCGVAFSCIGLRNASAQQSTDLSETALAIAPRDVAFFGTSVNMRESWEGFMQSGVVTRMRSVPFIQKMEREISDLWNSDQPEVSQVRATLESPNVRNLLILASDMFGDESFVYGEDNWCQMIESLVDFQSQIINRLNEDPEAVASFLNNLTPEDIAKIKVPTTVVGFRLPDDKNARLQLDALQGIVRVLGGQIPQLQPVLNKLKRSDLADGQTLTLTLDTSLIPLDEISGDERQFAEKVVELLKDRSISFSLGVKSNVLLMVFSEGGNVIDTVGNASQKLIDHPTMSVLKKADLSQLRGVNFASANWRESNWKANFGRYFQNLSAQFSVALESEEIENAELWKSEIQRDAKWLDQQLMEASPDFGDLLSWSKANQTGTEGFVYDWSEIKSLENASPMKILENAGSESLVLGAFDLSPLPTVEKVIGYAVDQAPSHIRKFIAAAEQDAEPRQRALDIFDDSWPLVEEVFETIRAKISPALKSNQSLISIAAQWKIRELPDMPASTQPLPLPEFALACSLDDRALFLSGCEDLYGVFDKIVEVVRKYEPDSVPANYEVPRPQEESSGSTSVYSYAEWSAAVPLPGFKPQLAVTDETIVLGYSDRQVTDMLAPKALETRPAWLTDQTPAAVVSYVDFAGMINAATPWIRYGISLSDFPEDVPLAQGGPISAPTSNDLVQIWESLNALGQAAGTTTVDQDGATVTRWAWVGGQ